MILLAAAFASLVAPVSANACAMDPVDRSWVDNSLAAWQYMSGERLRLAASEPPTVVAFDSKCRFEAKAGAKPKWQAEPHDGSIRLPDGNKVPAQVTSFAGQDDATKVSFFVMALPSVWQSANIPISGDLKGLTAVFLHEFSHVRQIAPLKQAFDAAEAIRKMPEDFSDDSLQKYFKKDPAYAAVFEKEVDLLYQAATDADKAQARNFARQALNLMEARQKRWFIGPEAYWKPYDDIFLTMEGFGQWNGYAWLTDPKGGGLTKEAALQKMRGGGGWWSQEEGLALFLVIDRFVPDWPQRAFAAQPALAIDLLRLAAEPRP